MKFELKISMGGCFFSLSQNGSQSHEEWIGERNPEIVEIEKLFKHTRYRYEGEKCQSNRICNCQQKFPSPNPMPTAVPNLGSSKGRNFTQENSLQPGVRAASRENWKCAFIEKIPTRVPDWSISMQMRNANIIVLIDKNYTFWLVVMELLWLVSKDANEHIALYFYWTGQVSAHWSKYATRNSLIKVGSAGA